jgi:hypothetical protein
VDLRLFNTLLTREVGGETPRHTHLKPFADLARANLAVALS